MELKVVNIVLAYIIIVSLLQAQFGAFGWRRRRRRRVPVCSRTNCLVSSWSSWSACSHKCGTTGVQTRTRSKTRSESCGGTCPYQLTGCRSCIEMHVKMEEPRSLVIALARKVGQERAVSKVSENE